LLAHCLIGWSIFGEFNFLSSLHILVINTSSDL
jgi:hypothetical protein